MFPVSFPVNQSVVRLRFLNLRFCWWNPKFRFIVSPWYFVILRDRVVNPIDPRIYPQVYNHYIYILPITHWVLLRILAVRKSRGEGSKASLQIRRFSPQPDAASWFPNFWRVSPSKYRDICLGDSKYSVSLFGKYFRSMVIVFKKYIVDQHYMICAFGFLSRKFRINQDVLP